jgi:hypothetical protein
MGRIDEFYNAAARHGSSEEALRRLIPGSQTQTPFPRAGQRKGQHSYDEEAVHKVLRNPPELRDVDPRTLHSTQPAITRAGVKHYLSGEYEKSGTTFADQGNVGNRFPVVYRRSREGTDQVDDILLSGHHRATAALIKGQPLRARVVEGGWGPARG